MRPRIAIPSPTSGDAEYNGRCWGQYASAIWAAGGEAVRLSLEQDADFRSLIGCCDGILLPGSPADVDPALYGENRQPSTAASDPLREHCDRLLLEHAAATGAPVLGICFGLQSLNVWSGGTLVQDLLPVPVNHEAGPQVSVAHATLVAAQSLFGELLSAAEAPADRQFRRLLVNSSHHQAVAIAGAGLTVVARCPEDGVVEAIEGNVGRAAVIGVQWHPERSYDASAASKSLFAWLTMAAADQTERSAERVSADAI